MKALIAGPCVSEFGWELMEWQGFVRKQAQGIDPRNVIICSTEGLWPLYRDFSHTFIPHVILCDRDGHRPRKGKVDNPAEVARVRGELSAYEHKYQKLGYEVIRLESWVRRPPRRKLRDQSFVPYGGLIPTPWKVVIHARNRRCAAPFAGDNYPQKMWDRLIEQIVTKKIAKREEIVAIGTKHASLLPIGVTDKRGMPLNELVNLIASSQLVIGPSSGPMHLASLCRVPHVVWATSRFQSLIGGGNKVRYEKDWNPFATPVEVILHKKGVVLPPAQITGTIVKLLYSVYKKDRL